MATCSPVTRARRPARDRAWQALTLVEVAAVVVVVVADWFVPAVVIVALSATRALGQSVEPDEGSTDANIPISLGIPAIAIGGGGSASGTHTTAETFDATGSWQGTARALLVAVALAGR